MLHVRYFAAARAAAGLHEEEAPAASLAELVLLLAARHGPSLATVLSRSSYLVDGVARHERDTPILPGSTVDVLPPFAGG